MSYYIGLILYSLIGLAGIAYALNSHSIRFNLTDHLPEALNKRKIIFTIGLAIVFLGLLCAPFLGIHHNIITILGCWLMLLGSAPWFNRRIVRKHFHPDERRVIRTTLLAGLFIALIGILSIILSFFMPAYTSLGTFFMGIAVAVLAGRLWWNMDPTFEHHVMVQSKRNYS